jgi:glycosyltransferase involved in cell wall biosynthesis
MPVLSPIRRLLLPPGSRRSKIAWLARLTIWKMREGPGPWLRAVRRGLFDALPEGTKARIVRRRLGVQDYGALQQQAGGGFDLERPSHITVVLPVYNQADMLASSIESVLAQTHANLELIVVDDGSSDGIDAVFERFANEPRVRMLRQANQKLPKALSNGFTFASGEYRSWTSADNEMEPEQLAVLLECLEQDRGVGMVFSDYIVIGEDGEALRGSTFRPQNRRSPDSAEVRLPRDCAALNVVQDNFVGPSFLYRGAAGRCAGDYAPKLGVEDYDYWMRVGAEFGIRHLGSDQLLYRYRWHDNSLNARARELRLFEIGEELMAHEAERTKWRAIPWEGAEAAPAAKRLIEVAPSISEQLPNLEDPHAYAMCVWGVDAELPFDRPELFEHERVGHFTAHPQTANTLALLTDQVWLTPEGDGMRRLATACANERVHFLAHNAPSERARQLPTPWRAPGQNPVLLLLIDEFAHGGLEGVLLDQAEQLRARGWRPLLCVARPGEVGRKRATVAGLELLHAPDATSFGKLLEEHDVRLVLSHHSLLGAAEANLRGVPFVQVVHNTYVWLHAEEIQAYREADAHTHAYLCVSRNVARYTHHKLGLPTDKLLIAPNAVAPPKQAKGDRENIRTELGIPADAFVLLEVASLYPTKSQRILLRSVAELRDELQGAEDIHVILAGGTMNEPYVALVRSDIDTLGLQGRVHITGLRDDIDALYAAADVFVLPSLWEGCSLAVMEAMRAGLPCILSDVGAAREQLRHGEGQLVPPPFARITELDCVSLPKVMEALPQESILHLRDAIAREHAKGPRRVARAAADAAFDIEDWGHRLDCVLRWFAQKGGAIGARPWFDERREITPR